MFSSERQRKIYVGTIRQGVRALVGTPDVRAAIEAVARALLAGTGRISGDECRKIVAASKTASNA
jgi:hypothetical protein